MDLNDIFEQIPSVDSVDTYSEYSDPILVQNISEDWSWLQRDFNLIILILFVWFGLWMLRSWRTWSVKGGRV